MVVSPECAGYGGGMAELRREIAAAWGHGREGKHGEMGEGDVGYL